MRSLFTALFVACVSFCASAQDYSKGLTVHPNVGQRVTLGVFCRLSGPAVTEYEGLCNVFRDSKTTRIDAGRNKYKIERDPFTDNVGDFYENGKFINSVRAKGNCWVGEVVRYCAM